MKPSVLVLAFAVSVLPLKASTGVTKWRADNPLLEREDAVKIHDDADPTEMQSCYSMGQINLTYESGDMGAPNVGLRITDPRGRKIGYDPLTHKGWQEFPLAQWLLELRSKRRRQPSHALQRPHPNMWTDQRHL